MTHTPGPVETLARLSLQSQRYVDDPEYRDAVDAVLGCPQYDAAPALLAALEAIEQIPYSLDDPERCQIGRIARAALALAKGE